MNQKNQYDVIVIGGGHNGLVAASYLQRSGLRTLVLEKRNQVGGACVTEEVFPGYRVSTTSYVCSLLRPKIIQDLELERYGLELLERDPSSFTPFPDNRYLMFWNDQKKSCEEIAKFSKKDAKIFPHYEEMLKQLASFVEPILLMTPPDPLSHRFGDFLKIAQLGLKARGLKGNLYEKVRILSQSARDFLDNWFESDELKATLATDGIIGAFASPDTPGTAYVLLHHVMGETFGKKGVWAYVRGGMGGIAQSMAKYFQSHGGEIRVSQTVDKIIIKNKKAVGVALASGEEIYAKRIVSNADPHRTFVQMLDPSDCDSEFLERVKKIRYKSATFKLNMALNGVPNWKALPSQDGKPGAQHQGTMHISPTLDYIEKAYQDAREGRVSESPVLECTMASVVDDTVAPPGKHLMSVFVQYAPYELKNGKWDEETKKKFADRCIQIIDDYAPGFKSSVENVHTLSPVDLETEYGMTGGNIFHGEMSLDQLFFMRPVPEVARYKTPIPGLYMCGSGTHPGGGVMGACGHNAAHEILKQGWF